MLPSPFVPALKICGLTRAEDLRACIELGVEAIGLNLWPGSSRYLALDEARTLIADAPPGAPLRVGVFVDAELSAVELAASRLQLDLIQPHGDAPVEPYAELAARLGIGWIHVVRGTPPLSELSRPAAGSRRELAPAAVLLDAAVLGYGGQGRRTDWSWAADAVAHLAPVPVWLAGGITPANVAEALERVRPAGIDVASGAERPGADRGQKRRESIAALLAACRAYPD